MDSTHIKANANKKKVTKQMIEETRKNYQDEVDKEIEEECERLGFNKPKEISLGKKEVKKVK